MKSFYLVYSQEEKYTLKLKAVIINQSVWGYDLMDYSFTSQSKHAVSLNIQSSEPSFHANYAITPPSPKKKKRFFLLQVSIISLPY